MLSTVILGTTIIIAVGNNKTVVSDCNIKQQQIVEDNILKQIKRKYKSYNPRYKITIHKEKVIGDKLVGIKEKKKKKKSIYNKYTKKEVEMLYRIVEAESTGQSIKCKMNVCNVLFNRIKSKKFPNTVKGVVFQSRQFSPISDGRYYSVKISKSTKIAVKRTYKLKDTTNGALYFCNMRDVRNLSTQSWFRSLTYIMQDNSGHSFYK